MNPFVLDNLKPALKGKRVLLGISGSIAAFKACDIIRFLRAAGAEVKVVLTDSASRFVTPITLENLSGHPVFTSLWGEGGSAAAQGTHHIDAARWADLALIAPATANTIAKLALGLADDLLSTELLAFRGPVVVAPAMNPAMYEHPATQANAETLRARGVRFAGPVRGVTSCGEEGEGRMIEPEQIVETVAKALSEPENGKRFLITLGPTRSPIDPVRFVTNRSSGLMGAALAWAAWRAGYQVSVVAGPTDAPLPPGATIHRVQTAQEMLSACEREFADASVFVATAAVLDWDVKSPSPRKLKKEAGSPSLEFSQNPDILATLAARKRPGQFVLGFAAETENVLPSGIQKRLKKGCDALFANDVSLSAQGFESTQNGGWWIGASEIYELPLRAKAELASVLVDLIQGRRREELQNMNPQTNQAAGGASPPPIHVRRDDTRVS